MSTDSTGQQTRSPQEKDELEELRRLLVGPEKRELVVIRERIENPTIRAQDVGAVLIEAIHHQRETAEIEFDHALTPTVEVGLKESVRRDPSTLANALYPVMGPAIRKSIANYISSLVQSFNQALEQGLSLQSIKWRIEALRTGKPFAEVVLIHSLVYRVEQLFLIHRESGLLLEHVVAPGTEVQDAAMVSGMLSAIQDYARDSFHVDRNESLESLQVGDIQVWVEQGPQAILAAAVRGHAPEKLRSYLVEKLENFHQAFGLALDSFQGDSSPFDRFRDELAECMAFEYKKKEEPSRPKHYLLFTAIFAAALVLGWMGLRISEARKWERFVDRLRTEPGIVVTSFNREGGQYRLQGLRDPLAADPAVLLQQSGLAPEDVQFDWRAYQAFDSPIVLRRAQIYLKPPPSVSFSLDNTVLHVAGVAPYAWIEPARERALLIPGVDAVNTEGLITSEQAELNRLRHVIESSIVLFPLGSATITYGQRAQLGDISKQIRTFLAQARSLGESFNIELIGRTDSTGGDAENRLLSQERANRIAWELRQQRIEGRLLRARGIGSTDPLQNELSEADRQRNRSVTFRAIPQNPERR